MGEVDEIVGKKVVTELRAESHKDREADHDHGQSGSRPGWLEFMRRFVSCPDEAANGEDNGLKDDQGSCQGKGRML